jgi:phosphoglycerate dehydrogenase-like enzyme
MPEVLIMDDQHDALRAPLAAAFPDVAFHGVPSVAAALPLCPRATVLVAIGPFVTPEMIAAATRMRWIQSLTTGTEALMPLVASRPDVIVTSARGVAGPAVAEFALLSMLALRRRYGRIVRHQAERRWLRTRGDVLDGSTVTIVGVGAIAEALAVRCRAFGMRVVGVSGSRTTAPGFDRVVPREQLVEIARETDALVLTVPLSSSTRGLIGAAVIDALPRHAIVVNVARGDVVDQIALSRALADGRLAGAALDVTSPEPLPPDDALWSLENVIVSPHAAGDVQQLYDRAVPLIEHNLRAFLADDARAMRNVVAHPVMR